MTLVQCHFPSPGYGRLVRLEGRRYLPARFQLDPAAGLPPRSAPPLFASYSPLAKQMSSQDASFV
jgi:hypothetical protein